MDHYPYEGYSDYRQTQVRNSPDLQRRLVSLSIEPIARASRLHWGPILSAIAFVLAVVLAFTAR